MLHFISSVIGVDVSAFLGVGNLVEVDEDAALLHVAELVVYSGAEHAHGGREAHVGADEWRDVYILAADVAVEKQIIFLEIITSEERFQLFHVATGVERCDGCHKLVGVGEIEVEEIQQQVSAVNGIAGIHRHLAKEILYLRMDDGECSKSVPQVVKGKDAFGSHPARLVLGSYKGTSQF